MKAFILAAGYGTRLRPLTLKMPKPLISVWGKPVIAHAIDNLMRVGIDGFVINLHYFGDKIKRYISLNYPDMVFNYSIEEKILDTGGGLKKASVFLKDSDFVVHNGDIVTSIDFNSIIYFHKKNLNDVTVVVMERETSRKLCFDENMRLCGWVNEDKKITKGDTQTVMRYAFCGIHIISPSVFSFMPSEDVFGIFDFYMSNLDKLKITGFVVKPRYWYDVGDILKLTEIRKEPKF